jgi:hypothetical protein
LELIDKVIDKPITAAALVLMLFFGIWLLLGVIMLFLQK